MVFTSLPLYHLDPPNWNQPSQQPQQPPPPVNESPHLLISPQPPMNNNNNPNSSGGGGSSRPESMAERARLAKIPQPEPALKCPRCDSTNTKFCYFNNYSLSQPRHFCKTCRRYWTRGGALRSVPVGGGCRRNKRSSNKSGNSANKSSSSAANSSSSSCSTATSGSAVLPSNFSSPHAQFTFLSSLHPGVDQYNLGLNFTALQHQQMDAGDNYQLGGGLEQWRMQQIQQFPFLGGLDASPAVTVNNGIYGNFDGESGGELGFHVGSKGVASTSGLITQMASVKMEDSHAQVQALSLPRQYLGMPGNDQYVGGGGGWATGDFSGFNSSSSGNVL